MIVTTSQAPTSALLQQAQRLAYELSATLLARRQLTVSKLLQQSEDGKVLVATDGELRLYDLQAKEPDKPLIYHPSMAFVKLKSMLRGGNETLITLSRCEAGDTVLDCTAGLCSDTLLFSMTVGEQGKVIALESQRLLYTIVREGLATYETSVQEIEQAMRRIELKCEAHNQYLAGLDDQSVDIVYFDPMFRQPLHESSAIKAIRTVANPNALALSSIEHAKRVARKCVILKEHSMSEEFERLAIPRTNEVRGNKIAYGAWYASDQV